MKHLNADRLDQDHAELLVHAIRRSTAPFTERFRPTAFAAVALGVAVSGRDLNLPALTTLAKLGAWVCGFDDIADDASLADHEIEAQIEQHLAIAFRGEIPDVAVGPYARLFVEVNHELRAAPTAHALWPLWTAQVRGALQAMAWERGVGAAIAAGRPPTLASYLEHSSRSICFELMSTAAAMLLGEPRLIGRLDRLCETQHTAAMSVRLANDLATWSREQAEGSGNALALVGEPGAQALRARTTSERARLGQQVRQLATCAPRTAAFVERLTDFFLVVYRAGDLCVVELAA